MSSGNRFPSLVRWMKFNLVGAVGIAFQLGALFALVRIGVAYTWATAAAVEGAVLHNFIWHERFTWSDRTAKRGCATAQRLLHFNITTGGVSILGNLLFMRLLVGEAHLAPIPANLLSIAGCSLLNFVVSDRWVFRFSGKVYMREAKSSLRATKGILRPTL